MPCSSDRGFVALTDADFEVPPEQYLALEYMDWKSGGDTNFAPIASADGELDCRGFWDKGKTDKDAIWTSNAEVVPGIRDYVESVGANFGRVRIIKLEPQTRDEAIRSIHRDDNNRFNPENEGWVVRSWVELTDNPDSYMLLMDNGPDGLPDRDSEIRVPLHKGARFLVDTQRLWHVVGAQRGCSPIRPDHQLRVGSDARALGRDPTRAGPSRLIACSAKNLLFGRVRSRTRRYLVAAPRMAALDSAESNGASRRHGDGVIIRVTASVRRPSRESVSSSVCLRDRRTDDIANGPGSRLPGPTLPAGDDDRNRSRVVASESQCR